MNSIRSKITITYVILTFVAVTALGFISSIKIESYFHERMISGLSILANVISFVAQEESVTEVEHLNYRITTIAGLESVRISIINADGVVIADSDVPLDSISEVENHLGRAEIQEALREGTGVVKRKSATVNREFMYVARMIVPEPEAGLLDDAYFIRIAAPLDDLERNVNDIRSIISIAGLIVLIGFISASIFISRKISGPLLALADDVKEINRGNLDKQIEIQSNDEIGMVAGTINDLVDKVNSDISRMKKLEEYRSEFLGNVSHELRTPIFSIQGFIETLIDGAVDDPNVNRDFLQKAYAQAARLNNLLGDLINISQIESGEMKMSFHFFPLKEFIDGVIRDMQPVADQHYIVLKGRYPENHPQTETYGDKQRLLQVMRNLVQNAIKYNKPYGEVVIRCEIKNNSARISVSDNGIGITEEHLPRIFERFYRVDRDRSREVGGTGLGLSIVKHIIEAHASKIHVTSTPSKGTTFSFELKTKS